MMTMASDGTCLIGLWFDGQKYDRSTLREDEQIVVQNLPVFDQTKQWLDEYFAGKVPDFLPPIKMLGTAFRLEVWKILLTIPSGRLMTYGEIAKRIAAKHGKRTMSAQAIGGAVGHNPISIIVPCHRVVAGNGSLTGYAGGIDRKETLLKLEGAVE